MTEWNAEARRQEELLAALHEHGHRTGDGRWWFSSSNVTHSEEEALQIVQACLVLGTPVTDRVTSGAWWSLISKVAGLDARVRELESEAQARHEWQMELRDRGE